ncbi:TVA2 protein, partial [Polyodon spathula]|nr:TVA2 protein [Polyodon spathula]
MLITTSEGQGVQMNCSYTFPSIQSLQWYRQHGSRAPQLIVLRAVSGEERSGNSAMILNEKDKWSKLDINETQNPDSAVYYCAEPQINGRITATLNKAHRLSNLSISSVQPADSAVYQCALSHSVSYIAAAGCCLGKLNQTSALNIVEGSAAHIHCSNIATDDTVFWYRQYPSTTPHMIVGEYLKDEEGHFILVVEKAKGSCVLEIAGVELKDAAVYYCVVQAQ